MPALRTPRPALLIERLPDSLRRCRPDSHRRTSPERSAMQSTETSTIFPQPRSRAEHLSAATRVAHRPTHGSSRSRVSHLEVSEGPRRSRCISDVSVRGAPVCVGLFVQSRSVRATPQLDHCILTDSDTDRHTPIDPLFRFGNRRPGGRISPPRPHLIDAASGHVSRMYQT